MMKKALITIALTSAISAGGYMLSRAPVAQANEIEVFLTRTCGCCKKWVKHLEDNGFKTKLIYKNNLESTKKELNVPTHLSSCHTGRINGYIVEGHVPASAIKKLLSEKPKVTGISVPGMPMGSPGMEGAYSESYEVVSFDQGRNQDVFMSF